MIERRGKNQRQKEFIRAAWAAGNEVISRGLPMAITIPRAAKSLTQDNVKFVWVRRPVASRSGKERGLTKNQLKVIAILEEAGLGKMVTRI